ncbi:MAG TPA: xanthine dehydrogenase family protein subunit M [Terriglobales bacterium]|jgi:xanthine dehydrogenase YagS FAD-binding subunit|nr:xanthine dehydrogenase family protein subunit M [Terriglobales bacterium]
MAVIRDVMPAFQLLQPTSIADAQSLLAQQGTDGMVLAGGMDAFDWLKDRIRKPKTVIDLSGVEEMRGIRAVAGGGLEIGAMTTLTEVVNDPLVRQQYSLLAQAASLVASPQIRNQGTLGGNVSQDTRCWYYRAGWPCYRAGGNICYADTPVGRNREHAILHAERCVAVNPSDTAPALIALDADFVIRTGKGERVIPAEDYFVGPDIDITRMNILKPGDLLTSIRIPATWAGAQFFFEKVRDRNVWDFPLLNVASAIKLSGNTIQDIRIVVNAAAARPLRLKSIESAVRGRTREASTGEMAGKLAVEGAVPLQFNAYKIPLMRNLVKRSITGVEEASWA